MAARSISKKSTSNQKLAELKGKIDGLERLNSMLIDNFASLQKVMTNLAVRFDSLADQISKLLQIFEISAKSFIEKQEKGGSDIQKDAEFLTKLNTLLEQNKTIAKGLTLLGEDMREKVYGTNSPGQVQKVMQIDTRRLPQSY